MTLDDLAAAAGVSAKTAGRVMASHPRVRANIRERVLSAAHRMGYRPNLLAQSLRRKSSSFVPVAVKNLHNPFHGLLVEELCRRLSAAGMTPLLVDKASDIAGLCEALHPQAAMAVLLHDPALLGDLPPDLRIVTLLGATYLPESLPNVSIGYAKAYQKICRRLAAEGRGQPLLLVENDDPEDPQLNPKHQAINRIMARAGNPVPVLRESRLLDKGSLKGLRRRCDTILCNNDALATRTMLALLRAGARIPQDFRIVGSDMIFPLPREIWSLSIDVPGLAAAAVDLVTTPTDAPARIELEAEAHVPLEEA
jgi:DNA-binding LacI/PurR family transcriptional regulator